jgi:mono/diheme cytochrome c family protein
VKLFAAIFLLAASCWAQSQIKRGEEVFAKSCATGYCHGVKGGSSGAPRLAGRGFNQTYISGVVTRGIPGTGMASFSTTLPPADLKAVVAYVATLNGVSNSEVETTAPSGPVLTSEAALGQRLFREAVRSFGRCSTCHEVAGVGISVAAPIEKVPASVRALKALATPNVKTGTIDGDSMPSLVLSAGKQGTLFYDLTSSPPVERSVEPGSAKFADGSAWRHSSVIAGYNDAELGAILAYLRTAIKP